MSHYPRSNTNKIIRCIIKAIGISNFQLILEQTIKQTVSVRSTSSRTVGIGSQNRSMRDATAQVFPAGMKPSLPLLHSC